MNKLIKPIVLLSFIAVLATLYFIMSIHKDDFAIILYLYPFVSKFWYEIGRLLLLFNSSIDLSELFSIGKYCVLALLTLTIFAFNYRAMYTLTLCIGSFLLTIYTISLFSLQLYEIYPFYTVGILLYTLCFVFTLIRHCTSSRQNKN